MKNICVHKDNKISFLDIPKHYACVQDGKVVVVDEQWITIGADPDEPGHGQHVLIKENGDIVAGLGGRFKNLKDLGKKKEKREHLITEDKLLEYLKTPDGSMFLGLANDIGYNPVKYHEKQPTETEIIKNLGGPDKTAGSCVSLAYAYVAQKSGLNVLDFKGGKSQDFFSGGYVTERIIKDAVVAISSRDINGTLTLLKKLNNEPAGKEFLLSTGSHMAVVRRTEINGYNWLQYLELQSSSNGWKTLGRFDKEAYLKSMKNELKNRFGVKTARSKMALHSAHLVDCDKLKEDLKFQVALGFINTDKDKQEKGAGGYAK